MHPENKGGGDTEGTLTNSWVWGEEDSRTGKIEPAAQIQVSLPYFQAADQRAEKVACWMKTWQAFRVP